MRPPKPQNCDIFPTLISCYDLKGHECEQTIIDMIEVYEKTLEHNVQHGVAKVRGQTSYITGDEVFLHNKQLVNLLKTLQSCCDDYCEKTGIDYIRVSNSWFNKLENNGSVDAHRHERSVLSGVYYPYVEEGSAPLMFESPLQHYAMNMNFIKPTEFNTYTELFKPSNGLLILFPSWLKHSVPLNQSNKRYTVSFNSVLAWMYKGFAEYHKHLETVV